MTNVYRVIYRVIIYIYIYIYTYIYIYAINLSRNEQVCLMGLFREILLPSLDLIRHDVINFIYAYVHMYNIYIYIYI